LQKLKEQLERKEISVADAIVKVLPELRGKLPDDTLNWLVNEFQGYSNSLDFYQNVKHNLPAYRVVTGSLKLLEPGGKISKLDHPFAHRGQYFLSCPVSWLESFASTPGELTLADLPDLTSYMGQGKGSVLCEFSHSQLTRALNQIRQRVISVLVQVEWSK
jgi:hypothetical protein